MILFPGRHLMGVLESHQLTPPNNMVELETHELCVKNQVAFMVQLEWVDVEFVGFFFLPNLHPLTLMVKKLGSPCQDMNPGPQGVWTGIHVLTRRSELFYHKCERVRTWNPVHRDSQDQQKLDLHVRTWNPVHGNSHSGKTLISVSGHETRSKGQIDKLLFLPRVRFKRNHPIFTQNWMYQMWM